MTEEEHSELVSVATFALSQRVLVVAGDVAAAERDPGSRRDAEHHVRDGDDESRRNVHRDQQQHATRQNLVPQNTGCVPPAEQSTGPQSSREKDLVETFIVQESRKFKKFSSQSGLSGTTL